MAKPTVLIVDDDPAIRKMLTEVLTLEGYPFETASGGVEALSALERSGPRVILLDISMDDLPGDKVLEALIENGTRSQHKVIFISANDRLERYRHLGPDAELAKPFTVSQLMSVVEQQAA